MEPKAIGIIGAMGRMGALMRRLFEEAGYPTLVSDIMGGEKPEEVASRADVLMLAVPISALEEVVREIGPATPSEGVLIDIASVKEMPVHCMLEHGRGEVIGAHPLFGPHSARQPDKTFFLCPARSTRWIHWFRSFLRDTGHRIVEISPAKHDRLMAHVQVLRHLFLICFGRTLMQTHFDPGDDLPVSGPWFQQIVGMLSHQLGQDPGLYADMATHNRFVPEVIGLLSANLGKIERMVRAGDRKALISVIEDLARYMDGCLDPGGTSDPHPRGP